MSLTTNFTEAYWPADTSVPLLELSTGDALRAAAADAPDQIAIAEAVPPGAPSLSGAASTSRTWTYAELLAEAEHCARWLLTRFTPGERIAVWAPNIPEWVILQYGAAFAGLVLVTANPALREVELAYVLRQSRSSAVFFTAAFRGTDMSAIVAKVAAELPELRETVCFADWDATVRAFQANDRALPLVKAIDPAQIQYTSGTTGLPKGALLHHRGMVNNARFVARRLGFPERGTLVSAMPLFHTAGSAMGVLGCAVTRSTYVLCHVFDPQLVLQNLQDRRGDCLFGVPTMLIALAEHPGLRGFDVAACRLIISGGANVPSELVRKIEAAFDAKVSIVYGQTEASPIVTQVSPDDTSDDRAHTIGRPLWQVEVKVVDPTSGAIAPVGEQGELCARGYQVMLEYFGMPEATSAAIDAEGWLHTGDLATMDDRGYFKITGRLKDMIIRGGENIYPREIEDVLFAHPEIAEVAVVGVADPVWGERVVAVLRVADAARPPAAAALHDFCRERLAPHKTPRQWFATDAFPLTGSGKVQKFRVVKLIEEGAYTPLP